MYGHNLRSCDRQRFYDINPSSLQRDNFEIKSPIFWCLKSWKAGEEMKEIFNHIFDFFTLTQSLTFIRLWSCIVGEEEKSAHLPPTITSKWGSSFFFSLAPVGWWSTIKGFPRPAIITSTNHHYLSTLFIIRDTIDRAPTRPFYLDGGHKTAQKYQYFSRINIVT